MNQKNDLQVQARELVDRTVDDYCRRREDYYSDAKLLPKLLKKDVIMVALRGVTSAHEWLDEAFAAHEASSEETSMGNAWQEIVTNLSPSAVGAGDVLVERESILWVVEIKSQTNTLNSASRAQTLKALKAKAMEHLKVKAPGRRGVRSMVGILRGPASDKQKTFVARQAVDRDIDGFEYREMVGAPFLVWLTGFSSLHDLVDPTAPRSTKLAGTRSACIARLHRELEERLHARGLDDTVGSVLELAS